VLSPELDLTALSGIDLRFDNVQLRSVPVRADVAQVFIDGGSSRASVDVATLPLGKLITDRAPADWLTFSDSSSTPMDSSTPIVAVKRSGRWYVSLWYSVAENARIAAGKQMPSVADRPVPIGADSPEAAVERLVREATKLDPRTVIGMLDPEEMAALYDYAPLFLSEAESAANNVLQAASDNGFEWSIDSISLSSTSDGDLASVTLDAIDASLTSPNVNGRLTLADGKIDVEATATGVDYFGDPFTTTYGVHDGCTTVETDNPDMGPSFNSCDAPEGGLGIFGGGILDLPTQALSRTNTADFGVITHKVDGKWFVSPIRTVTTAAISALQATTPDDLATAVDSITQIFSDPFGGSGSVEMFGSADGPSFTVTEPVTTTVTGPSSPTGLGTISDYNLDHAALVPANLPVIQAIDMPPEEVAGFLRYMANVSGLDLGQPDNRGGINAFVPRGTDPNAVLTLIVLDLTDQSRDEMAARISESGGELVATSSDFGQISLAVLDGNRLIVVFGTDVSTDVLRGLADSVR